MSAAEPGDLVRIVRLARGYRVDTFVRHRVTGKQIQGQPMHYPTIAGARRVAGILNKCLGCTIEEIHS